MKSLYTADISLVKSLLNEKYQAIEKKDKAKLDLLFKKYPELFDKNFLYYALKKYMQAHSCKLSPELDALLKGKLPTVQ